MDQEDDEKTVPATVFFDVLLLALDALGDRIKEWESERQQKNDPTEH